MSRVEKGGNVIKKNGFFFKNIVGENRGNRSSWDTRYYTDDVSFHLINEKSMYLYKKSLFVNR